MFKLKFALLISPLIFSLWLCSCKTTSEVEEVMGSYSSKTTDEYLEFLGQGVFKYNIKADAIPTDINQRPPYTGKYKITKEGEIKIAPISVHLGLFSIEFSENKDQVFVHHRFSGRRSVFDKVKP